MIHTPDRWLSKAGLATRGEVREWIASSRLHLCGAPVRDDQVVPSSGKNVLPSFMLDGLPLVPPPPVLLMANKPRGMLVSRLDGEDRPLVGSLLAGTPWGGRSFGAIRPLGRLDQASAGLLLLTNFPELFSPFLDPATGTLRTYRVQLRPSLRPEDRDLFLSGKAGAALGYGTIGVVVEKASSRTGWVRVTLAEGKNREVRTLFSEFGYRVLHLIRISFGPFELGNLPPGGLSDLTETVGKIGLSWVRWTAEKLPDRRTGRT